MRHLLLFSAVIVGAGWASLTPAMATSLAEPGLRGAKVIVTREGWLLEAPVPALWLSCTLCLLSAGVRLLSASRRVCLPASRLWLPSGAACLRLFSACVWRGGASTRCQSICRRGLRQLSAC